jgi:3-methyladenine DNA glycosylase AlkD
VSTARRYGAAVHPSHVELLADLRRVGGPPARVEHRNDSYGGSGHLYYRVPVPARRRIAREWLARNRAMSAADVLAVVESLFAGRSHEEKTVAALLLGYHPPARRRAGPADLDRWLGQLNGWAEVDTLCQNVFPAEEMVARWPAWEQLIGRFACGSDPNKRRAALVLLTRPVHTSDDARLRDLAVTTVDRLRGEHDPLITKAVSWLLRSLITHHRATVVSYLDANEAALPRIAVRETRTKLQTGTKRGRT